MSEDQESVAPVLLESIAEDDLLRILGECIEQDIGSGAADADAANGLPSASVVSRALIHRLLERSFPAIAGHGAMAAIETDVAEAILAHEPSMKRLERLARALAERRGRRKGSA